MSGLTDEASGLQPDSGEKVIQQARQAWKESMLRRLESLRESLHERAPGLIASRCDGELEGELLRLTYWNRRVAVSWPDLKARTLPEGEPCSTFDTAMLLYYLDAADGTPMADRWIGFRELPSGAFYHQAFQGYSGNLIARALGRRPQAFDRAARALGGDRLPALAPHAFSFQALPRIRLAAVLWPGDEEFPPRASVLFDAAASHYMNTDGLALLGAGLARRLIRQAATETH